MAVASSPSLPCIKIPTPSSSTTTTTSPSCSSTSSFRFPTAKSTLLTIRSSQTEGPLRRPVVAKPVPQSPAPPTTSAAPPPPAKPVVAAGAEEKNLITMEFQRQKAKELQEYFKKKKLEDAAQGPFFGFVAKNEISNGRWAMFGFAVGMLTEYATGSDFVDQVKILLSNFGIVDLE